MPRALEDQILLACARYDFGREECDLVVDGCSRGDADWARLLRAARAHKIAPLLYSNLMKTGIAPELVPAKILKRLRDCLIRNAIKNRLIAEELPPLIREFNAQSHDVLLVKHIAIYARLRGLFDLTTSGDLDLVIRSVKPLNEDPAWPDPESLARTWAVIDGVVATIDPRFQRRVGIEVDNFTHHDILMNGVIPIQFASIWKSARPTAAFGPNSAAYLPDDVDLVILSSINVLRKPFIRLKDLATVAALIGASTELDWDALNRRSSSWRCRPIVSSAIEAAMRLICRQPHFLATRGWPRSPIRDRWTTYLANRISACAVAPQGKRTQKAAGSRRCPWALLMRLGSLDTRELTHYFLRVAGRHLRIP